MIIPTILITISILLLGYNYYLTRQYNRGNIFKWPLIVVISLTMLAGLSDYYENVIASIIFFALSMAIAVISALVIAIDDSYYYRQYTSLKSLLTPTQYRKYKSTVIEVAILLFYDSKNIPTVINVGKSFAENKIDESIYVDYLAIKSKEDWISSYDLRRHHLDDLGYSSGTLKASTILKEFNPDYKLLVQAYEKASNIIENCAVIRY